MEGIRCYISNQIKKDIIYKQQNKCVWCQTKLVSKDLDHIIPIRAGGNSLPSNLQYLCE